MKVLRKKLRENKCVNCVKRSDCPLAQGVVVWKHCDKFQPDMEKLKELAAAENGGENG